MVPVKLGRAVSILFVRFSGLKFSSISTSVSVSSDGVVLPNTKVAR